MSKFSNLRLLVVASLLAVTGVGAASSAEAQTVSPDCKPMLDAQFKQIVTPTHSYTTRTTSKSGDAPIVLESISTPSAIYVQYDGKWSHSPANTQEMLAQAKENLANVKSLECHRVRDETVGGVATTVYAASQKSEGGSVSSQIWVIRSTGLPLKSELDMDLGSPEKSHISTRFDYSNVQPPASVK